MVRKADGTLPAAPKKCATAHATACLQSVQLRGVQQRVLAEVGYIRTQAE